MNSAAQNQTMPNKELNPMPEEKSPMPFPPGWSNDPLSEHMDKAIHNAPVTFARIKRRYEFLVGIDYSFLAIYKNLSADDLQAICNGWPNHWNDLPYSQALWPKIFMIRAHSGYRAACQLAMSGQFTESVPILRSCLEHALYALHMNKNEEALKAWNMRYGDYPISKPISRIFCMRKLKRTLEETEKEVTPKLLPFIDQLYELLIEFGGHPNKLAIGLNLEPIQGSKNSEIEIALLHDDPEFIEAGMALVFKLGIACLLIFKKIFSDHFDEIETSAAIKEFEEILPLQHEIIKNYLSEHRMHKN